MPETEFTVEEVEYGFEIRLESGVIGVCKASEGVTAGWAMLAQVTGPDQVDVFEMVPISALFQNLDGARRQPEFVYFFHQADYGAALTMFKKIGA
jgi:hypothetical protein